MRDIANAAKKTAAALGVTKTRCSRRVIQAPDLVLQRLREEDGRHILVFRIPFVDRQKGLPEERGARKRHATHSMADFADEKIVSFDELSAEEKALCSMLSSLIVGLPMTAIGIAASIL